MNRCCLLQTNENIKKQKHKKLRNIRKKMQISIKNKEAKLN